MARKVTQQLRKVETPNIDFSQVRQAFYIKSSDREVWRDKNIQRVMASRDTGPETLWITFYNEEIWWCLNSLRVENSSCDWNDTSMAGGPLCITNLNKRLTCFKDAQEAVCAITGEAFPYLLRILQGEDPPDVIEVAKHRGALILSVEKLIERLTWEDFDTLVYRAFSHAFGSNVPKFSDGLETSRMTFWTPLSRQPVHARVSYIATQKLLDGYIKGCQGYPNRPFYIYHSTKQILHCDQSRVDLMGPAQLAGKVASNESLLNWLMDVVSRSY